MGKVSQTVDQDIADTILERPHGFKIAGKWLYLYPVTLGKSLLLERLIASLKINNSLLRTAPALELMRVVKANRETVSRILAIHTLQTKREIFDVETISNRDEFLQKELSDDEMTTLLTLAMSVDSVSAFKKHLGLDREREILKKIAKVKNSGGNTFQFGGKSLYGALIDAACERYGWSLEYVVWGISYTNLQMMMADSSTSVYLTDDERKKVRISNDTERISADDPKNWARIKSQKWD